MILLPEKYIIIAMKEIFITTYPVYAAYGCKAVSVIAAVIFYGGYFIDQKRLRRCRRKFNSNIEIRYNCSTIG